MDLHTVSMINYNLIYIYENAQKTPIIVRIFTVIPIILLAITLGMIYVLIQFLMNLINQEPRAIITLYERLSLYSQMIVSVISAILGVLKPIRSKSE